MNTEAAPGVIADRQVAADGSRAVGHVALLGSANVREQRPVSHRFAVGAAGDNANRERVVGAHLVGHVEAKRLVINSMAAKQFAVQENLRFPIHAVEAQPQAFPRRHPVGVERRAIPADRVGGRFAVLPDIHLLRIARGVVALARPVAPFRHRGRLPLRVVEAGWMPRGRGRDALDLWRFFCLVGELPFHWQRRPLAFRQRLGN